MKYGNHALPSRVRMGARPLAVAASIVALMAMVLLCAYPATNAAWAKDGSTGPSVLVVDAGLGDLELASLHWLGDNATVIAEDGGRRLSSTDNPQWWTAAAAVDANAGKQAASSASSSAGSAASDTTGQAASTGSAPTTFLLGCDAGRALGADDIAWALDKIRESGAEPRTFVVSMGSTGISLREYAEDLASQKQSARADIVGLGFCGTPHNGYSVMEKYPEQALWEKVALASGLSLDDLKPQSARLTNLNSGKFPNMTKTLILDGAAGDLGFGSTDGAGVATDFALANTLSDQVEASRVVATVSRQVNLTSLWEPFTSSINYAGRSVDPQLTERLSAFDSYETSTEVQRAVRDFYEAWYSDGCPVTHNSNVLLLDLSGSMVERIGSGGDKLAAAKDAARQYLQAIQECSGLPQSAPMDVAVYGFNETLSHVASGYDQGSIDAIDGMSAHSETNIGIALDQALATLSGAPACADKHVLLLSDGESTRGKSDSEMLNGPVAQAAAAGIVIDTIGFGDVGESDAGFLQQVADATGGTYYQADDTYSLKVNFLKSYYSSLGLSLVDEEVDSARPDSQDIGKVDDRTSVLALGVVGREAAPNVKLMCGDTAVDPSLYTVKQENGLTTVQCVNPPVGDYRLELTSNKEAAHVFAVKQLGISHPVEIVGEKIDYSLYLLIGAGALLVVALVAVVLRSRSKARASKTTGGAGMQDATTTERGSF